MPLILISGYPSSGKTHRSTQLLAFLTQKITSLSPSNPRIASLKTVHISDHSLNLPRDVYATARSEKDARAAFASAIKREIGRDTIVVADGMNYIKGFRYQMFCEAKAVGTTSCVIHIGTPIPQARSLNELALSSGTGGYDPDLFDNLVFRYEEPNGMARWDSPLFTVPYEDEHPPYEEIWNALVGQDGMAFKSVRMNAATVLKKAPERDYLHELDRVTSEVVGAVGAWQRERPGESGGSVIVGGGTKRGAGTAKRQGGQNEDGEEEEEEDDGELRIELPAHQPVALPQLQRLRRQFIALNRTHEVGKSRIRGLFVDYLNDAFQK